jgi:hypothetical protein
MRLGGDLLTTNWNAWSGSVCAEGQGGGGRRWRVFKAKAVNGLAETDYVKVQECTHPQAHRLTHASADVFYREHILYREHMCRPQIDTCVRRIPVALAARTKESFQMREHLRVLHHHPLLRASTHGHQLPLTSIKTRNFLGAPLGTSQLISRSTST